MKNRETEREAEVFILKSLEEKGWDTRNPLRNPKGQVFTQNQCLEHTELGKYLVKDMPEYVVKLSERHFWVIEAKRSKSMIEKAVDEAQNQYGNKINKSKRIKATIVTGVAGNESENYTIKNYFLKNGKYYSIKLNGKEMTGLLSPEIAKRLLDENNYEIEDVPITEEEFLSVAEEINSILHEGSINKSQRAKIMATLLLAMAEGSELQVDTNPQILVRDINTRADFVLQKNGKPEFSDFVKIALPSSRDNHIKFKCAIIRTIQELENINIRSAMNSGNDILGKFYEVFLKYGNGAKEIGIVLTPRHITKFAVEIMNINKNDLIFDPTCGTGGFLVSAFDKVKKNVNEKELNIFKNNNLFGIEQEDEVVALAIVNMIFRGDGKTNLIEGNCFHKFLNYYKDPRTGVPTANYLDEDNQKRILPITKVLMNPPFALKKSDEKEFKFINQALKQMQKEGLLFSILPSSVMVKQGKYLQWRKELLKNNTLVSVITFPDDLFYPVGVLSCAIIVKKGIPHNQEVLWLKITEDGLLKSKGKRLPSNRTGNQLEIFEDLVTDYIQNRNRKIRNIPELIKSENVDFEDKNLELLPEVYLDGQITKPKELIQDCDNTLREIVSFMLKHKKEYEFVQNVIKKEDIFRKVKNKIGKIFWKEVPISEIFEDISRGEFHASNALDEGNIPLISCSSTENGMEGYFDIEKNNTYTNAITIASDGAPLSSFYHFYKFASKDNVLVCKSDKRYRFTSFLFFITQLQKLKWRFSYGRKCYENKVHKIKIFLPYDKEGKLYEDFMEFIFKSTNAWHHLKRLFYK